MIKSIRGIILLSDAAYLDKSGNEILETLVPSKTYCLLSVNSTELQITSNLISNCSERRL
jgi:hypothetical protein